jgi:pyruvate dehydrogenase E2 component (dihydrolipoamide acetyltransferase)
MNRVFTEKDLICRNFQIGKFDARKIVPAVSMKMDVDIDIMLKKREELNGKRAVHVTIYQYLLKLIADTLIDYPLLFSLFYKGKIISPENLIINVPVSVDNHVEYVVIRNPETKSIEEISVEMQNGIRYINLGSNVLMQSLIDQHTMNKIQRLLYKLKNYKNPVYFLGKYYGYFPVTNFGTFHVDNGTTVLSEPIVAALVIGKSKKELSFVNNSVHEVNLISLTLSFDHRVMDGAYAGNFLSDLKQSIEHIR